MIYHTFASSSEVKAENQPPNMVNEKDKVSHITVRSDVMQAKSDEAKRKYKRWTEVDCLLILSLRSVGIPWVCIRDKYFPDRTTPSVTGKYQNSMKTEPALKAWFEEMQKKGYSEKLEQVRNLDARWQAGVHHLQQQQFDDHTDDGLVDWIWSKTNSA